MPKATAALTTLILAIGLTGASRADERHGRVATDYCDWWYWFGDNGWESAYMCRVYVSDIGGSWITAGAGFDPALSPDGTRIAFVTGAPPPGTFEPSDIIVVNLRERTSTNLTASDPAPASSPPGPGTVGWHSKAAGAGRWSCMSSTLTVQVSHN